MVMRVVFVVGMGRAVAMIMRVAVAGVVRVAVVVVAVVMAVVVSQCKRQTGTY
jgi:hypothetical protein